MSSEDCQMFKIWRHSSLDIFVASEKYKSETKLKVFAGSSGKLKVSVESVTAFLIVIEFQISASTKKEIISAHVFDENKIIVLAKGGSLLKVNSLEILPRQPVFKKQAVKQDFIHEL